MAVFNPLQGSCTPGASPSAPANLTLTPGNSTLTIGWTVKDASECVCAFEIELRVNSTAVRRFSHVQSNMRVNQNPFVACGLPSDTSFTVLIRARNLQGTSGTHGRGWNGQHLTVGSRHLGDSHHGLRFTGGG